MKKVSQKKLESFQQTIWSYYKKHKRAFPWREATHYKDLYKILVSEVMLQQTQAGRVVEKYESFIVRFPDFASLHAAPLSEVLRLWKGLGYNRRAIALKKIAQFFVMRGSTAPLSVDELDALPSIGPATAASISAFAWNTPVPFIETNIRRVFIHFFFRKTAPGSVIDASILPLVEATLPKKFAGTQHSVREWYYALMDYGAALKSLEENPNKKSATYRTQSRFKGSNREVRGAIVAALSEHTDTSTPAPISILVATLKKRLVKRLACTSEVVMKNITALEKEGFLVFDRAKKCVSLKNT